MSKEQLRVWWIPQVPGRAFHVSAESPAMAKKILDTLADYDQFQLDNNIKGDYCNAGGLEVFEDGQWSEWFDDDDNDIDHWEPASTTDAGVAG